MRLESNSRIQDLRVHVLSEPGAHTHTHARPWLLALDPGLRAPRFYLSQPVPQRLDHDAAVVITLVLVGLAQLLHPEAGNGEQTQVVGDA